MPVANTLWKHVTRWKGTCKNQILKVSLPRLQSKERNTHGNSLSWDGHFRMRALAQVWQQLPELGMVWDNQFINLRARAQNQINPSEASLFIVTAMKTLRSSFGVTGSNHFVLFVWWELRWAIRAPGGQLSDWSSTNKAAVSSQESLKQGLN